MSIGSAISPVLVNTPPRALEAISFFQDRLIEGRWTNGIQKLRGPATFPSGMNGDAAQKPYYADQLRERIESLPQI